MFIKESQLLRESINEYLIVESRQILLENIKNDPRKYFVINEDYKKYCTEEEWKVIEEGIWDTIKDVAGKIGDWFSENPRQGIQSIADVVSIFDPTGIVDLVNGIFYYIFKDYFSAFFSFLGAALTGGGLLFTATGAGAVAGIPMEIAGKAVQSMKVGIKTGKVANTAVKDIGITAKLAAPAISKISKILEKSSLTSGIAKWLESSTSNVAKLATKEAPQIVDVTKAVGGGGTEIANNPVVKGLANKVVDATKKYGAQTAFAGLGLYGTWIEIDDSSLRKVAIEQMKQDFKNEGVEFDVNSAVVKKYLPKVVEELKAEKNKCKSQNPEECKSWLTKFSQDYPTAATIISKVGSTAASGITKGGELGASALEKIDVRNI